MRLDRRLTLQYARQHSSRQHSAQRRTCSSRWAGCCVEELCLFSGFKCVPETTTGACMLE
jgi:hypothetical protein